MKYLMYLITFANDILAIPIVLFIHLLWGSKLYMEGIAVCTELKPESWPMNTFHWFPGAGWYSRWGGTTFGSAIMYRPDPGENTRVHEHVHVHQMQASMTKSLLIGLLVLLVTDKLWLSYIIWSTGYILYATANALTALLRGDRAYRDSVHEEHAYLVGELLKWDEKAAHGFRHKYSKM